MTRKEILKQTRQLIGEHATGDPESLQIQTDPFNLSRFVLAQDKVFTQALAELRNGRKEGHWMWFIFPQIVGLGKSLTAKKYAIKSREEAEAYVEHPILMRRLVECSEAVLSIHSKSVFEIFGSPDDMKLRSCLTLFSIVVDGDSVFARVLEKFFGGEPDHRTIELLDSGME